MPYAGTLTPGEGETETVSPVMPSVRATSSQSQSVADLQAMARNNNAGAQVDLRTIELKPQQKKVVPPKAWLHFVAGGAGGMCGAIITSPLDVVKTRLQSDLYKTKNLSPSATRPTILQSARRLAYHFVETGHLLKEISSTEGPRALFRGLGPTLVGVIPARSINFYTYGNGKVLLAERFNDGKETSIVHLSAAAIAGIVTASATNPIWVVKTRLQLDSNRTAAAINRSSRIPTASASKPRTTSSAAHFSSTAASSKSLGTFGEPAFFHGSKASAGASMNSMQMALHIVRKEGIKGLYKGMSASYLGVAEGTIQWVLYEKLKQYGASAPTSGDKPQSKLSSMIGAAGLAKFTASLITYPHEVLRTRLRQQAQPGQISKYTGLWQTITLVAREEGVSALYGGLSAHLLRVVPNAVVMFSIYELTLRLATTAE